MPKLAYHASYWRNFERIAWFNRVYESIRRHIEDEKQTGMPHIVPSEVVDLIVSEAIHCPMEYCLGEGLPSHTEWLPQVWNMPMPGRVTQTSLDFYNLSVSVPEGYALRQSDNKDFPELGYRMQEVCPTARSGRNSRPGVPMPASPLQRSDALNVAPTTWMAPSTAGDVVLVLNHTAICRLPLPLIATGILLP